MGRYYCHNCGNMHNAGDLCPQERKPGQVVYKEKAERDSHWWPYFLVLAMGIVMGLLIHSLSSHPDPDGDSGITLTPTVNNSDVQSDECKAWCNDGKS